MPFGSQRIIWSYNIWTSLVQDVSNRGGLFTNVHDMKHSHLSEVALPNRMHPFTKGLSPHSALAGVGQLESHLQYFFNQHEQSNHLF